MGHDFRPDIGCSASITDLAAAPMLAHGHGSRWSE